jgi:hypothetical protein
VFVVTSAGFNDQTWLDYAGHPHTDALRVIERYRRKAAGELELQMTFEDPKTYARPWTISLTGRLAADTELLEFFLAAAGQATHFVMTIVEGDLKAIRK